MVGNIVQGNRLASAQGRDMGIVDEESDSARKVRKSLKEFFVSPTFLLRVLRKWKPVFLIMVVMDDKCNLFLYFSTHTACGKMDYSFVSA
jgi:hypothetical protein